MPATLTIRRFVDRFYSRPDSGRNGYSIPLLGLDACGKTTLLQRLKIGDIVESTPIIGVQVETTHARLDATENNIVKMISWDVGGREKTLPRLLLSHYPQTAGLDALIWLVDSSDRERLTESVEEFCHTVDRISCRLDVDGRNIPPVLILATKQDLPDAMTTEEIQRCFEPGWVPSGLNVFVVGTTLGQSPNEGVLSEAFRWLLESIKSARMGQPPPKWPTRSPMALEIKLDSWLERAERDSSTTQFLRQFENTSLPNAWDHYTHIRTIYSMLTVFGRQTGRDMILQGIEKYIALSGQAGERPFNVTMTYFWIQVVHFGICGMPPAPELPVRSDSGSVAYLQSMLENDILFDAESVISEPASDWTFVDDDIQSALADVPDDPVDESTEADDTAEDNDGDPDAGFVRFLLLNPFVVDEDLWTEYYSPDVMMGPKGRAKMVLPDKRRLPNLVGREVISSSFK
ncbi:ADP-ribosylation factor family-domain-containing protein [Mycena epipterygia]|nr:ADP-ribosylation factor family-domain-containing protein [Mycena epipterygia]